MKLKKRLDQLLQDRYPQHSKRYIQSLIMQGLASVNGKKITKPGTQVACDDDVVCSCNEPRYVSRAGSKLEHALKEFKIKPDGLVALDAGISTGGFTDCLLQHNVAKVYGVDVGYGQVHEKIRCDQRVVILERTNLRTMDPSMLCEKVDLVTLDLSFISVLKVLATVSMLLKPQGILIILIKPQFEAERHEVGYGGIIRDSTIHDRTISNVIAGTIAHGFRHQAVTPSPLEGTMGNKEFLAHFIGPTQIEQGY